MGINNHLKQGGIKNPEEPIEQTIFTRIWICIVDGQSLKALGSSVAGLSSSILERVPPKAVLDAVKDPSFAKQLENVSPTLKIVLVQKLMAAVDPLSDLVKYVPNELVPYIPKAVLAPGSEFNIEDLNSKPWTPIQAAMFFDDVIKKVSSYSSLSPHVLSGFTCAVANSLDTEKSQQLAKAMKQKNVKLSEEQLSCLAKMVTAGGIPKDLNDYPKELLLVLSPSDYAVIGSCKEYISRIGEANIDVLQKGSPQRTQLLLEALSCLNISGPILSKENAHILGHLVCDLNANYIAVSGGNFLEQLNQCQSFSAEQVQAIQALLGSGNTHYGPPEKWSSSTLKKLSGLLPVLDHSILKKIPRDVFTPWLRLFLHTSHLPRKQLASVVESLQSSRRKRASACPADKTVTEEVIGDELMPLDYTPEELRVCLTGQVLTDNLGVLMQYAFTDEQLAVIKQNLDEMYPRGYPESVVRNLGSLFPIITLDDIKKWKITSPDTLAALLENQPDNNLATIIIKQYTNSGGPLNALALDAIGSRYICLLDVDQLKKINEVAIRDADKLDPSNCSQTTKDILYPQAKRAFSDRHNQFPDYYNLIKPYLGGAPGEDLRALSKDGVNMDIYTFMGLRNDSVLELTPDSVKGLMGMNLKDLKSQENNSPLKEWIRRQRQSELDPLGLTGGLPNGYINITPRINVPPETSAAPLTTNVHALQVFSAFLLTLLLTFFLS
ncbi:mesothelin [Hemicordylus capensis]|uniref:mesothelin n=1 Tax=Hemicordylus capensis TaxID=884348 RepID=UPI0023031D57|nr:mesothelin [Hemicordylus capensis]